MAWVRSIERFDSLDPRRVKACLKEVSKPLSGKEWMVFNGIDEAYWPISEEVAGCVLRP